MASPRQIHANQSNARKSTGPATEEGKAASRRNALRHGLAGTGIVLPEDEAGEVAERLAGWRSALKPRDAYDEWIAGRLCALAVRLERCEHHERALLELGAARASGDWDTERRLAAEVLGESLPKAPGRVALELRRNGAGRAWLGTRWEALGAILDAGATWDEAQRSLALDLLGTPRALRTGPTRVDADPPALRALVDAELAGLAAIEAEADDADDVERTAAELGFGPVDRELALVRRYGRGLARQIHEFRKHLTAAGTPHVPDAPDPAPTPPLPSVEPEGRDEARAEVREVEARKAEVAGATPATARTRVAPSPDRPARQDDPRREPARAPAAGSLAEAPFPNRKDRRASAARSRRRG